MSDAKDNLREDVAGLESAEELGRVESFILGLKASENAGEPACGGQPADAESSEERS